MHGDLEDTILASARPSTPALSSVAPALLPDGPDSGTSDSGTSIADTSVADTSTADTSIADIDETIIVRRHGGDGLAASTPVHTRAQAPASAQITAAVQAPGSEQTPAAAPTPAVSASYRFRIGQTVIELDKDAYIGRNPSRPRVLQGGMPRLVRVTSPQHEVSGTHLEIRQCGSSVIVTDLRSTNGSTVRVPGATPRHLRQGESMTVSPGALVDIGDGILIEILPMQHQ